MKLRERLEQLRKSDRRIKVCFKEFNHTVKGYIKTAGEDFLEICSDKDDNYPILFWLEDIMDIEVLTKNEDEDEDDDEEDSYEEDDESEESDGEGESMAERYLNQE